MGNSRTHSPLVSTRRLARLIALAAVAGAAFLAIPAGASADGPATCDGGVPTTDANGPARRYTCDFPFSVEGFGVKQTFNVVQHPGTSNTDATITHMDVDVVDINPDTQEATQVPISRLMLHHIVFANLQQQDRTCAGQSYTGFDSRGGFGGGGNFQRFYAAGEERAKFTMPDGYGYAGGGNLPWGMVYMVMNHKQLTDDANIRYSYTVSDNPQEPVTPYWLDERNCHADPIYNVPGTGGQGSTNTQKYDFTMPVDGRLIGGGGHVHGGARKLTLTQPDCNDRRVAESLPTWGYEDHPFYNVQPILHEPGPVNMTAFGSETGIPLKQGSRLRLNATYDDSEPHVRVMGIMVVYVAEEPGGFEPVITNCDPLPDDIYNSNRPDGRDGPVPFTIPLTGIDLNGNAVTINAPPGAVKAMKSGSTIDVANRRYSQNNIKLKKGGSLTWKFVDGGDNEEELHNITLADGPVGIGSPNLNGGRTFTQKFSQPGTYKLFCGLHPVQMTERVIVKAKPKKRKAKR
ncbi:MAG: hypothetical protein EXQ70_04750 [Solirubrobacterales bacterium]|nr:hypothetical protein [Solirubrobacterales bacterium]